MPDPADPPAPVTSAVMPPLAAAPAASWHALMDLHATLPSHWTMVGGQLVHLHCAERGQSPDRPTDDIDAVVDVRARPDMLDAFTSTLLDLGFAASTSADGNQHRWTRVTDPGPPPIIAQIDVLIPEGVGERSRGREGASGGPTIETPGGSQALQRSEVVTVTVNGRTGTINRPSLVGALIGKAATHQLAVARSVHEKHRTDFTVLAALVAARDFRTVELSKTDIKRLRAMVAASRSSTAAAAVRSERLGDRDAILDNFVRAARLEVDPGSR